MNIEDILAELTLDEKCKLTCGSDMWHTHAIERLKIPALRMSDGPSGVRGPSLHQDHTSMCIPCPTALGATWNPTLVYKVGTALAEEAHTKSVRILLAPALNLHRSPLGGRNFECYSEDPFLAGKLAAAFIRGVQSNGVAATIKHFVANEAEHERNTTSSVVDERSLRELYLAPFEIAVRESSPLGVMSAYNRLNGIYCGEHRGLLNEILKNEWGFDGIVMSDWWAIGSTVGSATAGQDLEMPGPGRYFGALLAKAVRNGNVAESEVDDKVRRLLNVIDGINAWTDALEPSDPCSVDKPHHRNLARQAAIESIVLLRNDNDFLPLSNTINRLAVIGPNAANLQVVGGGSTTVIPHYSLTLLDAIRDRIGNSAQVTYEPGCHIDRYFTAIDDSMLLTPNGDAGILVEFFKNDTFTGEPFYSELQSDTNLSFADSSANRIDGLRTIRARAIFTPARSGMHTFSLDQNTPARLRIDRQIVIDTSAPVPSYPHHHEINDKRTVELRLEAHSPVEFTIEISTHGETSPATNLTEGELSGWHEDAKVGYRPPPVEDLIDHAVSAATDSDAVVLVVGTSAEWESEGYDRESMKLPGEQNQLIERVLAANSSTVVVINAGSPVCMPWTDSAQAIIQTWFGGQEMANAIADVVLGYAEPGGRLPTSLPINLEQNPSYGNFPGENDEILYGERLLVGYRWYDTRSILTRFCFGHGLSYTTFKINTPVLSRTSITAGEEICVEVPVTNIGKRRGSEVVQCYVRQQRPRLFRPNKELKAFGKLQLEPGETGAVSLKLDSRSFAYWDPGDPEHQDRLARKHRRLPTTERRERGWYLDAGVYELHIGRSVDTIDYVLELTAAETARILYDDCSHAP